MNNSIFDYSGYSLLRDPHHNKGLAFTEKERDAHYLRGLLPPVVVNHDLQVFILNLHSSQLLFSYYVSLICGYMEKVLYM